MSRKRKTSPSETGSVWKNPVVVAATITAVLALLGIVIKSSFDYQTSLLLIEVTQTAEAKQTQIAFSPTPTKPVEIAVLKVTSEAQPDGSVRKKAELSIESLGLGTLELTAPATIKAEESAVIQLIITPDSALHGLPQVAVPSLSANDPLVTAAPVSANNPDYVLKFSDRIQVYPIMIAELTGVNFEIVPAGPQEKPATSSLPVGWTWSVTTKSLGRQVLVLTIAIPVIIDQTRYIISAQPLKNIPIEMSVQLPAPLAKISDSISLIVVGLLVGVLTVLIAAYSVKKRRTGDTE